MRSAAWRGWRQLGEMLDPQGGTPGPPSASVCTATGVTACTGAAVTSPRPSSSKSRRHADASERRGEARPAGGARGRAARIAGISGIRKAGASMDAA